MYQADFDPRPARLYQDDWPGQRSTRLVGYGGQLGLSPPVLHTRPGASVELHWSDNHYTDPESSPEAVLWSECQSGRAQDWQPAEAETLEAWLPVADPMMMMMKQHRKDFNVKEIIKRGNLNQLETLVTLGHGQRLLLLGPHVSSAPLVQEFLDNLPDHLEQIEELHKAASRGNVVQFRRLLDRWSMVVSRDPLGATPLHKAVLYGHYGLSQFIAANFEGLQAVDIGDHEGRTPLHYAAGLADRSVYQMLLQYGPDTSLVDQHNRTAEFYLRSPEQLHLDIIQKRSQRINANYSANLANRIRNWRLQAATSGHRKRKERSLSPNWLPLQSDPEDNSTMDGSSSEGSKPGRHSSVDDLAGIPNHRHREPELEINSANLKKWIEENNVAAMEGAVLEGHGERLRQKAEAAEAPDAAQRYLQETVPALMSKIQNIHAAVSLGDLRCLQADLEKRQEYILSKDHLGMTPLHKATILGHIQVVAYILDKFPETVNARDRDGRTALHYSTATTNRNGNKIYKMLVRAGADVRLRDAHGKTADYYRVHFLPLPTAEVMPGSQHHHHQQQQQQQQHHPHQHQHSRLETKPRRHIQPAVREKINQALHAGNVQQLQELLVDGYGQELVGRTSFGEEARKFLKSVPQQMETIRELHEAATNGDHDVLHRILVRHPEMAAARDPQNSLTPFHQAVIHGQHAIIDHFVQHHPSAIHLKDNMNRTALHLAAIAGNGSVYRRLVEHLGFDPRSVDQKGKTAEHYLRANAAAIPADQLQDLLGLSAGAAIGTGAAAPIGPSKLSKLAPRPTAKPDAGNGVVSPTSKKIGSKPSRLPALPGRPKTKESEPEAQAQAQEETKPPELALEPTGAATDAAAAPDPAEEEKPPEEESAAEAEELVPAIGHLEIQEESTTQSNAEAGPNPEEEVVVVTVLQTNQHEPTEPQEEDPNKVIIYSAGDAGWTHFDENGEPILEPEPVVAHGAEAEDEPVTTGDSKKTQAEPVATEGQPAESSKPEAEPVATEDQPAESSKPEAEPVATEGQPAESSKPKAEPVTTEDLPAEPEAKPEAEPVATEELPAEPETKSEAEPTKAQEPKVESPPEQVLEPKPTTTVVEEELGAESKAETIETEPVTTEDLSAEPETKPEAEPVATEELPAEPETKPEAEPTKAQEPKVESPPERVAEPEPETTTVVEEELGGESKAGTIETESVVEEPPDQPSADQPKMPNAVEEESEQQLQQLMESQGSAQPADAPLNQDRLKELIEQWLEEGDVVRLEHVVIAGQGHRLLDVHSDNKAVQDFLRLVPPYMDKIKKIHSAVVQGNLDEVQKVLTRKRFALCRDQHGCSPLHLAVLHGHTDLLIHIITKFPETIDGPDNDGRTPFHYAAVLPDKQIYQILETAGASKECRDRYGYTPVDYLQNGKLTIRDLLLKYSGRRRVGDGSGRGTDGSANREENGQEDRKADLWERPPTSEIVSQLTPESGSVPSSASGSKERVPSPASQPPPPANEQNGAAAGGGAKQHQLRRQETFDQTPLLRATGTAETDRSPVDETAFEAMRHEFNQSLRNEKLRLKQSTDQQIQESAEVIKAGSGAGAGPGGSVVDSIQSTQASTAHLKIANGLSAAGYDLTQIKDEHGRTVLHLAAAKDQKRSTFYRMLQQAKYLVPELDSKYRTIREVAVQNGIKNNLQVIDQFILDCWLAEDVQYLNVLMLEGYATLLTVVDAEGNDVVALLKRNNLAAMQTLAVELAELERAREELHTFIRNGYLEGVTGLLENHPKQIVIAKSNRGRTSLHLAVLFGNLDIMERLIQVNPPVVNTPDNLGRTPLHYAMAMSKMEEMGRILIHSGANQAIRDVRMRAPSYYFIYKQDIREIKREEQNLTL